MPATPSGSRLQARAHNAYDLTYQVVEGQLLQIFTDQNAARRIGLIAVSRLIDADPIAHPEPGWYLWIEGHAGAFLMEWAGAEDDPPGTPERRLRADFLLRYYPDPSEEVFRRFGYEERFARVGPAFDHTATPHFRGRGELDPSWYAIGGLRLEAPPDLAALSLTLAAQDTLRQRREDPAGVIGRDGRVAAAVLPAGDVDRRVPGWALAWALVDRLLLALGYLHRSAPSDFSVTESPGVLITTCRGRPVAAEPDPEACQRQLTLRLPLTFAHHQLARPIADPPPVAPLPDSPHANPAWWQAASWQVPLSNFVCERCLGADAALDTRFSGLIESPRIGDFHV